MERAPAGVNSYNGPVGFAIRSSRVVLREHDKLVIVPARVQVEGSLITRVERDPEGVLVGELDMGTRLVSPAFVNAHTHLSLAFLRGISASSTRNNLVEDVYFAFEQKLSADDVRAFARMGAYESLLHGVGFVWDHYYGETAVAEALLDTGLAGVSAPTLQDLSGPGRLGSEAALSATLEIAGSARFVEGGVFAALGPHATDTVSPGLFRKVAGLAAKHQLPVHLHVAQSYDELVRAETREGRSPLALLSRDGVLSRAPRVLMAHALFAHEADLKALDRARHTLVFCPSSQLQFGFPAAVPLWSELGCSWLVATDCAPSNDSMNLQKELRLCAGAATAMITGSMAYARFLEFGGLPQANETWQRRRENAALFAPHVTTERLLARVWHEAGALHPARTVGVIEPNALANLTVWDTEHPAFWPEQDLLRALALGDTTQAIHALFVAGKQVGIAGDFVRSVLGSAEYRDSRREAERRLNHLLG